MSLLLVLYLLFIHWVGDFLCQSNWMASEKYRNNKALLIHTSTYSLVMMAELTPVLNFSLSSILLFGIITFVTHTIQDYITSRMTHKKFQTLRYNGVDGAFTVIGFDQFLHYVQIFVTYYFLTN